MIEQFRTVAASASFWFGALVLALAPAATPWAAEVQQYTHDELNRLTRIQQADGSAIAYTYDSAGNLRTTQRIGGLSWKVNPRTGRSYAVLSCTTWHECQAKAAEAGGQLATIRTAEEDAWLVTTFQVAAVPAGLWIGYSDAASEGDWRWASGEWSGYTHWAPGEPNNSVGLEHYGILQPDGTWNDGADVGPRDALVERVPFFTNPGNGHRYQLIGCGTWLACEAVAVARGAHLATIRSSAENDWLVNTFKGLKWAEGIWAGASDAAVEGNWVWASGEAPGFFNWYPGEPNNYGGLEHCVLLGDSRMDVRWNDVPCDYPTLWEAVIEWSPSGRAAAP